MQRLRIEIDGRVQGVGFRPFVYRLATEIGVRGWVRNSGRGVEIDVEGSSSQLDRFVEALSVQKPPLAEIVHRWITPLPPVGHPSFTVMHSSANGARVATVLPDAATCPECLAEVFDPKDRRYRYPFTNCTNCGPRYSLIEALPYDRSNTTMRGFAMCPECRAEYEDPANRRFHAQPNACPKCGPQLALWDVAGDIISTRQDALHKACKAISAGRIVALKGLGGFQLLVDARDDVAVRRLRTRKHREAKPLALMYPSLELLMRECHLSAIEQSVLKSIRAPILLAGRREIPGIVSPQVAPGNPYLGVMLPYTPLHHLLLAELGFPIVATSGNISEEPICIDEQEALTCLRGIADLFLVHNRPIARQVDDSVVQVVTGGEMVLRSARGYAPLTLPSRSHRSHTVAVGGHLKNTIAVTVGEHIIGSQHIGDLSTMQAHVAMNRVADAFADLYELKFDEAVVDMHPDYQSTKLANARGLPTTPVQHHLAHVYSCMIDHDLRPPLLGISWDGTGYGTDGTIWGGEFLQVTDGGWQRVAHLRRFRLPGGDKAILEPRRAAIGLLHEIYGERIFEMNQLEPIKSLTAGERSILREMLSKKINSPVTSSAGRLFDAVASLLGLTQNATFEGQAAMMVQFAAENADTDEGYDFAIDKTSQPLVIDWDPMVRRMIADIERAVPAVEIAARFHNTLVEMMIAVSQQIGGKRIVLTGGCFQNRLLLEMAIRVLREEGFEPYWHHLVPPNDGGLAVGQLAAVAVSHRQEES